MTKVLDVRFSTIRGEVADVLQHILQTKRASRIMFGPGFPASSPPAGEAVLVDAETFNDIREWGSEEPDHAAE